MIGIENLIIEVTRRCNIQCAHCLRGAAQNLDLKKESVDNLLNQVYSISGLTFSGGEPVLNVEIIEYIVDSIIKKDIPVYNFYQQTTRILPLLQVVS